MKLESSQALRSGSARLQPFREEVALYVDANHQPPSDPRLFLAAGRRDRQVLGLEQVWAAGARRHLGLWRRCQRSLPAKLHHCDSCAGPSCTHTCSCSLRAEMGDNLASVNLGDGRTAVAIGAGEYTSCAILVRLPSGRLDGGDLQNKSIEPHTL